MSAVSYQLESVIELWDELVPLFRAHYDEIAQHKDIPLDPDINAYKALEDCGEFRFFTARKDGELIGYAAFIVRHHLHYQRTLMAYCDVLFVAHEHRRGWVGTNLIEYADRQLADEGVEVVFHHVKTAHPKLGRLLESVGYVQAETIWNKRLKQGGRNG